MDAHRRRQAAAEYRALGLQEDLEEAIEFHDHNIRTEIVYDPAGDAVGFALVVDFPTMAWLTKLIEQAEGRPR